MGKTPPPPFWIFSERKIKVFFYASPYCRFQKEKVRHPTDCLWAALSSSVFPQSLPHSRHNCDQEYHCFDKVMPAVVVMINLRFGQNKSDPRMLCANIVIRNLCVFEINLFHIKKRFRRLFFCWLTTGK